MSQLSYLSTKNGAIKGAIRTFGQHFAFWLEPNAVTVSEKSPTHLIMAKDSHGPLQVGIAWERKLQRGDYAGYSMFSLIINDPMFDKEMNFSAFPSNKQGHYEVRFERKRSDVRPNGSAAELSPPLASGEGRESQPAT